MRLRARCCHWAIPPLKFEIAESGHLGSQQRNWDWAGPRGKRSKPSRAAAVPCVDAVILHRLMIAPVANVLNGEAVVLGYLLFDAQAPLFVRWILDGLTRSADIRRGESRDGRELLKLAPFANPVWNAAAEAAAAEAALPGAPGTSA